MRFRCLWKAKSTEETYFTSGILLRHVKFSFIAYLLYQQIEVQAHDRNKSATARQTIL